jgi:hypothetical protein
LPHIQLAKIFFNSVGSLFNLVIISICRNF